MAIYSGVQLCSNTKKSGKIKSDNDMILYQTVP